MVSTIKKHPYGLWKSPITPVSMCRGINISDAVWDDGSLIWREQRSSRSVLVVQPPDGQAPRDLNSDYSVRARLGYGGGDFTAGKGSVYFVEAESGRIYRQPTSRGTANPITPSFGNSASPTLSPDGKWLLFVHSYEDRDVLAIVDSAGKLWPARLVSGEDFYMQPCWSPDGKRVAWIAWNHPNMPWDGTFLRMGRLNRADKNPDVIPGLEDVITIAGDEATSIFQPHFSPDGRYLAYISDKTGWWQIYLYDLRSQDHYQITDELAEHGVPAWVQGMRTYQFSQDGKHIYYIRNVQGFNDLWQVSLEDGHLKQRLGLDEDYTQIDQLALPPAGANKPGMISLIVSGCATPTRLIVYQLPAVTRVVRRSTSEELPVEGYAPCQPLVWKGMDGESVYGVFFPPHNPRFTCPGQPPLIVNIHGGPTSQVRGGFRPGAQYFTSRGYAFLEVNYRGSTGYGREYRNALRGNWGIYDVQDAVSGAQSLAEQGLVDGARLVIMGGSAGGFTVLKTLEDYPGVFKAGICLYGVSNQFTLAADTHKFEAHYSDTLLGPLPEAAGIYHERSPIFFADRIRDPLAIFQGEDDQVVPQSQSEALVESLRRRDIPHIYHLYPGEGHGFRKPETIEHFYKTVEQFLQHYVIFT